MFKRLHKCTEVERTACYTLITDGKDIYNKYNTKAGLEYKKLHKKIT